MRGQIESGVRLGTSEIGPYSSESPKSILIRQNGVRLNTFKRTQTSFENFKWDNRMFSAVGNRFAAIDSELRTRAN